MRRRGTLVGLVAVSAAVGLLWPRAEAPPEVSLPAPVEEPAAPKPQPNPTPVIAAALPTSSPNAGPARLEGDIVDSDRVPLAGAELEFEKDGMRTIVRADSQGRFRFEAEDGEWSVKRVWAPGHLATESSATYFARAGAVVSGLRFELENSRRIRGKVITSTGAPVEGAEVSWGTGEDLSFDEASLGRTDSVGSFSGEVNTRMRELRVQHACCFSGSELISGGVADLDLTIRLREVTLPIHTLAGIVVDRDGKQVAGAMVEANSWARMDAGTVTQEGSALSDDEGKFSLRLPGKVAFASAKHGERQSEPTEMIEGKLARLVLEPHDATISGRVTDEAGQPVTKFMIQVSDESWTSAVTGDGRFHVTGLRAGRKTVSLEAPGFAVPPVRSVILEAGTLLGGVDFVLSRGRTLRGLVVDDRTSAPLTGATISSSGQYTRADDLGRFELSALPHTTLDLLGRREGYADRLIQVEPGGDGPITISLRRLAAADAGSTLDYEGIGVRLDYGARLDGGSGYPVESVHPEGGARVAGIQVGDEVLRAEGSQAGSVPFEQFNAIIKGPEGTVVRLTLRRDGRTFDLNVVRRKLTW